MLQFNKNEYIIQIVKYLIGIEKRVNTLLHEIINIFK